MSTRYHQIAVVFLCSLTLHGACTGHDDKQSKPSSNDIAGPKIRYYYDAVGRLIQATGVDGISVHYSYDAAGNMTGVRHLAADTLSVADFTPVQSAIGATVNIFGSGFDPIAANNTVTFNGSPAAIVSASPTTLVATVPASATSGKIAVSNALGTAMSSRDFLVSGTSTAPTITDFAPRIGSEGTVVTLSGNNFQSNVVDDKVEIAGRIATVVKDASSPAATQLRFKVPSATSSGTIAITTQFGHAATTSEFFAVPTEINPGDVGFTGRLSVGGPPLAVTTTIAGKKAALLFDGDAGQALHLLTQSGSFASGSTASVYAPDGSKAETLSLTNTSVADFTKVLTLAGTYMVILSPAASDKGTVQMSLIADVSGTLTLDTSTAVSLSPGQNARFTFSAQANAGYGLAITGLSFTPSASNLQAILTKADGTFLTNCPFSAANSCDFPSANFATTGGYRLTIDPAGLAAASFTVTLSSDATGTITLDTAPTTVTIARAGQNARYSFSGMAGQLVTLVLTGNALDDGNPNTNNSTSVSVFKPSSPNTSAIASTGISTSTTATTLDMTLPETGNYTLLIAPVGLDKGSINAQVKSYATGPLAVDGSTAVSLGAGQNARFSFTAQAGTGYGLAVTDLSFMPSGGNMPAVLRKADGTQLTNCNFSRSNSCDLAPSNFATTGTYLLDFDPSGLNAASFTAVFSADASRTLPLDGDPVAVTTVRAGQNARCGFSGTAGQLVTLVLTGNAIDDGDPNTNNTTSISAFKPSSPNGAPIVSGGIGTQTAATTLDMTLTDTGNYTVLFSPDGLDKGSVNAQLKSYVTGPLTVDGSSPVTLSAGQNARLSFAAQAGKGYGLAVTGLSFTPSGGNLQAVLRKADGTVVTNCSFSSSNSCDFLPTNFSTSATYSIDFDPAGLNAASFIAQFSNDASGTLAVGGGPSTVTIARAGQNARYTFAGTAGQTVRIIIDNNVLDDGNPVTNNSTTVSVFKPSAPNGAPISSGSFATTSSGLTLTMTLTDTGAYTILVNPVGVDSGTFNLRVE